MRGRVTLTLKHKIMLLLYSFAIQTVVWQTAGTGEGSVGRKVARWIHPRAIDGRPV